MRQTDLSKAMARSARQAMPDAERMLWQALRNRRFHGLKMRRQVPFGATIVDFYCAEKRLAVCLGPAFGQRTLYLAARGFRVLDLDRDQVVADLPATLVRIAAACGQRIDPSGPI